MHTHYGVMRSKIGKETREGREEEGGGGVGTTTMMLELFQIIDELEKEGDLLQIN